MPAASAPAASLQAVLVRELEPHGKQVWFAVYSPDGSLLATSGSDAVVRLWDAATFEQKAELKGHKSYPTHGAWSPDGKRLATAGWDKKLAVWDIAEQKLIKLLDAHELGLRKVAWSPDGKTIVTAGEDGKVGLWDAETLSRRQVIDVGLAAYSVALSPDGKQLAVGNGNYKEKANGRISLWDPATGNHLRDVPATMGYVFHLNYLDQDHLLAANAGEGVTIWNLTSDQPEPSYRTQKDVRWTEASRDGRRIVAMHFDGKGWISVWDRGTSRPLVTFNAQDAFGFTATFSPDGKQIVSGAEDGKLKVWELKPAEKTVAVQGDKK
jgi:WD40 repeat protein